MAATQARYDDMVDTVVTRAGSSAALRAVGWQQLVDLLARAEDAGPEHERAYQALAAWRADASVERRTRTCATVADRLLPIRLFEHLATDDPAVAAPVLVGARVPDEAIVDLLPMLSGPARALIRNRPTQTTALVRALDAYGPADRTIGDEPNEPKNGQERAQPTAIRTLVERIDQYRVRRQREPVRSRNASADVLRFAFETDRSGVIRWTDAQPRGAIVGLSLSHTGKSEDGADWSRCAATSNQFARRLPIRSASVTLPAGSAVSGLWRVDASPVFADSDGRFTGYVGHARRGPSVEEVDRWALARSNDFRQLVHELKTPLNAIIGFSELIDEELLGPVPSDYRMHAAQVRQSGLSVLASVEDVDLSARLDAGNDDGEAGTTGLVAAVSESLAGMSNHPFVAKLGEERPVAVSNETLARLIGRLLHSVAATAEDRESVALTVTGRKRPRVRIATPKAIAKLPAERLTVFSFPTVNGEGPLLGLEFTLRLLRRLAERAGGSLTVDSSEFTLSLPPAVQTKRE